jgi:hypothetical protein
MCKAMSLKDVAIVGEGWKSRPQCLIVVYRNGVIVAVNRFYQPFKVELLIGYIFLLDWIIHIQKYIFILYAVRNCTDSSWCFSFFAYYHGLDRSQRDDHL